MSAVRKNINLFLMDGEPSGRLKCSLLNWTGLGYKVPRSYLPQCADLKYLKQSGVYFLFGADKEGNPAVYVGQAGARKNKEGLLNRIKESHNSIELWTDAVMFTTTNDSLGPTEISYLENRFCNMALKAKRYIVKNANDPTSGNLTEEKEAEMEEFIQYASLVIGVLGYKVFESLIPVGVVDSKTTMLYFKKTGIDAKALITNEGFVLCQNSQISPTTTKSCPSIALNMRQKYNGFIKDWTTTEDILFTSPSSAAAFVGGSSLSGNEMWRTSDGTPLKALNK